MTDHDTQSILPALLLALISLLCAIPPTHPSLDIARFRKLLLDWRKSSNIQSFSKLQLAVVKTVSHSFYIHWSGASILSMVLDIWPGGSSLGPGGSVIYVP